MSAPSMSTTYHSNSTHTHTSTPLQCTSLECHSSASASELLEYRRYTRTVLCLKSCIRGAKILMLSVPMFNIKFINSLSFIPMKLAPKTFGINKLAKGYFPDVLNTSENQNYVGPKRPSPFYYPDGMSHDEKETFLSWHIII